MSYVCRYGVFNCPQCRPQTAPFRPTRGRSMNAVAQARKDRAEAPTPDNRKQAALDAYARKIPTDARLFLTVPFQEKDKVKALGARWDADSRRWYVDNRQDTTAFGQWGAIQAPKQEETRPIRQGASFDELMAALNATPTTTPIINTTPVMISESLQATISNTKYA